MRVFSVGSKVGSLDNASHKASGGNVKIEDRRLEWKTVGRTDARNPNYTPKGGDKKVPFIIVTATKSAKHIIHYKLS